MYIDEKSLTYNDYLRVPELLSLQNPQSKPAHHDEMLFIVIHQAYELWFKLVLHEIERAIRFMQEVNVLRAHHFVHRVVRIMQLLVQQIHILETMTPVDFLQFRDKLNPASGFQSLQFREIEFVAGLKEHAYLRYFENRPKEFEILQKRIEAPGLRENYYDMLRKLGFDLPSEIIEAEGERPEGEREAVLKTLVEIYQNPDKNLPLYLLSESLVEFDEYLALWREHHVRVVERIIGRKQGTGGSPGVNYLRQTTSKKCFPYLWEVRTLLHK